MRSYEDYINEVEAYITDCGVGVQLTRWALEQDKIKQMSEEFGKTPIDWDSEMLFKYFTSEVMARATVINYRSVFADFYDYEISKGNIFYNPAKAANINYKNILDHAQDLLYYTDDDINRIIGAMTKNEEYNTALLLTYYEGVAIRSTDVLDLKTSKFHPEENVIETKYGAKKISSRLSSVYKQLRAVEEIVGDKPNPNRVLNRKQKLIKHDPDDLFAVTGRNGVTFLNRRIETIGEISNYTLRSFNLAYSGFLNFVAKKVGVNRCVELVVGNSRYDYIELEGYAKDYVLPITREKIRPCLYNTALAMRCTNKCTP